MSHRGLFLQADSTTSLVWGKEIGCFWMSGYHLHVRVQAFPDQAALAPLNNNPDRSMTSSSSMIRRNKNHAWQYGEYQADFAGLRL